MLIVLRKKSSLLFVTITYLHNKCDNSVVVLLVGISFYVDLKVLKEKMIAVNNASFNNCILPYVFIAFS